MTRITTLIALLALALLLMAGGTSCGAAAGLAGQLAQSGNDDGTLDQGPGDFPQTPIAGGGNSPDDDGTPDQGPGDFGGDNSPDDDGTADQGRGDRDDRDDDDDDDNSGRG